MPDQDTHVIVGASLAGAKAAEALREEGFDGRVVLLGKEDERPYERPPLSKDYLRGESEREKVYVHPAGFYDDHDIELAPALRWNGSIRARARSSWRAASESPSTASSLRPAPSRAG